MGAKVQCGNYFPGYYSMKDLNEDARNSSWLHCHVDKMQDIGQYCNGFFPRPMAGYSEYDKELLKQTMLKHEAIFKKQVYELHRLYRIQKDLMDDVKKKELNKYSFPVEIPQSSPCSFQMALEDTQRNWQIPILPMVRSNCCNKPSISIIEKMQYPSNFLKEGNLQVGSVSSENGVGLKNHEFFSSKVEKLPRKMFDLQLPADEYIDSEESELVEDEKIPESEVKLTLGMGWGCDLQGNGCKADSRTQNNLYGHQLVDLNDPNQGMCVKEAAGSTLVNYPSLLSLHEEIAGTQLSRKPNVSSQRLPQDFFLDSQKDGDRGTCLNFLHMEREGSRRELLSFDLEAGQSRSNGSSTQEFTHNRGPSSLESLQVGLRKTHNLQFVLPEQRQRDEWFREETACGADISKASPVLANSNCVGFPVPPFPGSFPNLHLSDDTKDGTPLVSSLRKSSLNQIPLVQALPCYNGSVGINIPSKSSDLSTRSPEVPGDKWSLNNNLRPNPSFKNEVPYQNCYNHGLKSDSLAPPIGLDDLNLNNSDNLGHEHSEDLGPGKFLKGLDCEDVKSAKDMSLSLALPNGFGDEGAPRGLVLPNGYGDEGTPRIDSVVIGGKEKLKDRPELTIERFGNSTNFKHDPQIGLGLSRYHLQATPIRDTGNQKSKIELESETVHTPGFAQNFIPTLQSKAEETQKDGASDIPNDRKILDSPVKDEPYSSKEQCNFGSDANLTWDNSKIDNPKNNPKDGLFQGENFGEPKPPLEKQLDNLIAETGEGLAEQQTQLEISSKDEADFPSSSPVSSAETDSKNICLPNGISPEVVSLETNRSQAPVRSSQREIQDSHETMSTGEVAETIIAMSFGVCNEPNGGVCCSPCTALKDCLDWFAEVVVSNGGGVEGGEGLGKNGDCELDDEGLDFFELMTLRLSETKVDEYLCKPRVQEEEEKGRGSVLQSQPSRAHLRRGHQRRDFQREILPGIASLSRHEVAEDLQMIGGLMRASGCSWQTGLARRTVGRNDWYFPAQRRRHTRCRPAAGAGSLGATLFPQQAIDREPEPDGRRLKGIPWGKTTRRRMQRFPTGTACTSLV